MAIKGQSITISYVAWDAGANAYKTGDVANHALRLIKDGGASAATTNSPSEVDATNMPGVYKLTLTATEMTANAIRVSGKSSTANIVLLGFSDIVTEQGVLPGGTTAGANNGLPVQGGAIPNAAAGANNGLPVQGGAVPNAAAGTNGGLATCDANNNLHGLQPGTGTGQINMSGGKVPATVATGDGADAATLVSRLTAARAGYLDNLNVGGPVASHADILAINQSASKHVLLTTVGQYEPGETYTVEARTFAASDGSAVNADSTPTLTATGQVSGNLSGNLSAASNPATGVYRWTFTPGASPTLEQIRFDLSATISGATFTLSGYAQTIDEATTVWTATDQSHLTSIFNALPSGTIAAESDLAAVKAQTDKLLFDGSSFVKSDPQTNVTVAGYAGGQDPATLVLATPANKLATDSSGRTILQPTGLDAISVADPGAPANVTTLPKMIVALWRRFFRKSTLTATQLKTYADDGTTIDSTQTVSDDGTTQTQGAAT
jgi:hypothetical protein